MSDLIRLGLQIPNFTDPGVGPADLFEHIAAQAVAAEESGFDSVYVMDHFFQLPMLGSPEQEMLECYTLLSALAARTSKVRLGAMVGGVTYRNPAFLAKTVTTLDVVSRGRAIWAIGAAWFEQEHHAYGYDFGTFTDRFEKLEEALQIVGSMFTQPSTTFSGKWYTVKDALNSPPPVQSGGIPILIGGTGPNKTLRMVAQYADACNVFGGPKEVAQHMRTLDEHCERLGRDPRSICRTRLGSLSLARTMEEARAAVGRQVGADWGSLPDERKAQLEAMIVIGDPDTVGEKVRELLDAGLDGLIFRTVTSPNTDDVRFAGETLSPLLRG